MAGEARIAARIQAGAAKTGQAIRISGLSEYVASLKKLDAGLPKALRLALNAAAEPIQREAKSRVPSRTGRAAGTVKLASLAGSKPRVRIKGGGSKAPYYPWLDFGGKRRGRGGGIAERPFIADGRYIYASYYRHRDEFEQALREQLVAVARTAGLVT